MSLDRFQAQAYQCSSLRRRTEGGIYILKCIILYWKECENQIKIKKN